MSLLAGDRIVEPSKLPAVEPAAKHVPADGQDWLGGRRAAAAARFAAVGYPTRRQEEWRFTNVEPLAKGQFAAPEPSHEPAALDGVASFGFGREAAVELVFVDGQFAPHLSSGTAPAGVTVRSLADAITGGDPLVREHLARHADIDRNPFVALNTARFGDGAYVDVPRGVTADGTVHLLFASTGQDRTVTHPRVLVVVGENAEVTVVESYVGTAGGVYLTNAVTEFVVAEGARVDHCKLQQEATTASHVATTQVRLAGKAQFVSHSATLGALLTRNEVNVALTGEYADATLNGLVLLDGVRHCDNHTLLDHAAANCPSHELYKHVLAGRSTGVFKGKILVRPDSQKTDSKQSSKTLLLSDDAVMNSMPALEIYADDVKCTHGSTTGPMDEEQIFYLRSRGVSHESAKHLMTYAFAADITRRIRVAPVRARIENLMAASQGLPLDLRITDLGSHDEAVVNI